MDLVTRAAQVLLLETALHTSRLTSDLERAAGCPVLTATQVTLWAAARSLVCPSSPPQQVHCSHRPPRTRGPEGRDLHRLMRGPSRPTAQHSTKRPRNEQRSADLRPGGVGQRVTDIQYADSPAEFQRPQHRGVGRHGA